MITTIVTCDDCGRELSRVSTLRANVHGDALPMPDLSSSHMIRVGEIVHEVAPHLDLCMRCRRERLALVLT